MNEFFGKVSVKASEVEGMQRVVESGAWVIGIKNYKLANDRNHFDYVEKHLLTDEAFVLLKGECTLLVDVSLDNDRMDIRPLRMEPGKVYCVHKGIWHNMIMSGDAKLILVENADTSSDNSEMHTLKEAEIKAIRERLAV
jgi:ureidoglycolate hydrolase